VNGEAVATWTMRSAEWLSMRVPRPIALPAAELYLSLRFRRLVRERETVAANLSRVLASAPESDLVQAATREAFALYGRYWYETFALRSMPWDEVLRRFSAEGIEWIDQGLEAGKGVILALPHMGNWDAAGHWLALQGYPIVAVAEELKPARLFELFYRHRRALGMDIVPLTEGRKVGDRLVRKLSENRLVALLADRNLSGRGVQVDLFGEPYVMPAGPAFLALATGAALLPCAVYTTDDGWNTRINSPLTIERTDDTRADVATLTQALAAHFERFISAAPADWHVFQPAWAGSGKPDTGGSAKNAGAQ
jgi:lauroyl/myristoyl acyltransferase